MLTKSFVQLRLVEDEMVQMCEDIKKQHAKTRKCRGEEEPLLNET